MSDQFFAEPRPMAEYARKFMEMVGLDAEGVPQGVKVVARRAFCAGFHQALCIAVHFASSRPEEFAEWLAKWHAEANEYAAAIKRGDQGA